MSLVNSLRDRALLSAAIAVDEAEAREVAILCSCVDVVSTVSKVVEGKYHP